MEHVIEQLVVQLHWALLAALIVASLATLGKGADWLVDQAVHLSSRSGIPKVVIGATIVSLGTTTPEAAVSVLAAVQGKSGLALGNAVGSIICDTGLILGLACLITPLPLDRQIVNRQGWIQVGSGFLLVAACVPWLDPVSAFVSGGNLTQLAGWAFLFCLCCYLWVSVLWARQSAPDLSPLKEGAEEKSGQLIILVKLILSMAVIVASSWVLIPAVSEAALRMSVPESIIAATLVAFGTSLPELVTAMSAVRQGHGELAVGNVVGADILNVLFVAGASAAVTKNGLLAPPPFFALYFPSMLLLLIVLRVGILACQERLPRVFGAILLICYMAVTFMSYSGQSL